MPVALTQCDSRQKGTLNTSVECGEDGPGGAPWQELELTGTLDSAVSTASDGTLWLFAGTDSGFEGRTELYSLRLKVLFTPAAP